MTGSSGSTTGNAATATALETARTIGGVSFDGTANINLPGVNTSGNQDTSGNAATATTAGTVTTAAQPNITSVGTLTTLTVDDITINGSTISDAGNLTVDVGGDIILDSATGYVKFLDTGTEYGRVYESANRLVIQSMVSDADLLFSGVDGGVGFTALTLDMSDAGAATFNAGATFSGNINASSHSITGLVINGNSYVYTPTIYLNDTLYHTNDTDTYLNFQTDEIRLAAGGSQEVTITPTGVQLGDTGNGYFRPVTGGYGSIEIDGGAHLAWEGYSIGGRAVFMHNNSTTTLIYDDVNDKRLFAGTHGGAVNLYHNGTSKLDTTSSGVNIDGDLNAVDNVYVAGAVIHEGDTNTYMNFATDTINLYAGGNAQWNIYSSYISGYAPIYNYSAYFDETTSLSGTTPTIDAAVSGVFYLTMSGNTTFTFTNTSTNWGVGFVLYLTGNGGTVTWPASVDWAGGTAPDAPANGETDVLVFHTRDGSNWVGVLSADAAA